MEMKTSQYGNCPSRNTRQKFYQYMKILFLVVVLSTLYFLFSINYSADVLFNKNELFTAIKYHEDYVINTESCRIPAMESDKKMMEKYIKYPENLKPCPHANYSLLEQNGTHIWFVYDALVLKHYKIKYKYRKRIVCCYSAFFRPDYIRNINDNNIDQRIEYKECIYFKDIIEVNDEFVRVQCIYGDRLLHDQFFIFVPFKQLKYNDEEIKHKSEAKPAFNVLIIGVDNISRLNFYRTMPKTASFMKSRGAVELRGYNKVGDNSLPNLVPLLMGYSVNEIKEVCHPMPMTTFDDCPFLWHWYKDAGYYTAFGEDSGVLGTFNYALKGFRKTPTDYYLHPFVTEAEKVAGNSHNYNVNLCMNEFYLYQILLDYIETLTVRLKDSKLFGFFWETTMSHDMLNYPIAMDESYLRFFEALEKSSYLNKTIILLMSDHGIRWGDFRNTKLGYLEERLPLAQILLPLSFRANYTEAYKNLKYNSRQLTTPFDLHETLIDLIDLENIRNKLISERGVRKVNVEDRGISLFLKVPSNRTCKSADIDDQWCTCHHRVEVSNTSDMIVTATEHLIAQLNDMLVNYPQCARLELDMVQQAEEITLDYTKGLAEDWKEFSVRVKVKPSGGVFEATLRHDGDSWSVRGDVSRLNLYGNQSICVNAARIKLYCYCKQTKNNDEHIQSVTTIRED